MNRPGMKKAAAPAETLRRLRVRIMEWYEDHHRPLPWRRESDPYRIWVSEVMLQQTRVDTVVPYYEKFLARFPTLESLARADQQEVLKGWEGLGYYARARNLHRAAGLVMETRAGIVPDDEKAFRRLPGVGAYIAAAVLSIAFGKPLAAVDGNVRRVLSRLFLMDEPVNGSASARIFQAAADRLLDRSDPGGFNQAVMELGALICTSVRPGCGLCPISECCLGFRSGLAADYPKQNPKPVPPVHPVACGVVHRGNRVLITRRRPEGLLGGLWEFPGGKIREGESPAEACAREIREETGLTVAVGAPVARVRHAYTHFKIVMDVFHCNYLSGEVVLNGPADFRWVLTEELGQYPFPGANHKFLRMVAGFSGSSGPGVQNDQAAV